MVVQKNAYYNMQFLLQGNNEPLKAKAKYYVLDIQWVKALCVTILVCSW